ncbi:MAG: oligosaccharide flippase family protein [Crocinitomicaceae bacterium]|nr:oligosaccharide flippase family protein [Crocinitomicaceae bacterium]
MQKKFFSNLALMVLLNLMVKPVAIFGIDTAVQNRVGAEDYGIYFSLLNFSILFNIVLDFGINNFTTKNIAQSPKIASKYLEKILTFRFILFIFYAVISYSVAFVLGWEGEELYLLSFLVFNQFLITLIAYIRSYFGGLMLFKTEAFLGVLDRLLLIFLCGAVLYFPVTDTPFRIEWFIWIQTVCYGIALIVGFILLFSKIGVPKLKYRPVFSYAIVRKSFPYALLILLMTIYTRVDSVMIERLHPNGRMEAGYYAQGFRLLNALFMFAMLFSNLLFPMFSKMFTKKQDVLPLLSITSKLLIGGSILIAIVTYFNSEYILGLVYNSDIAFSNLTFQLLMFSFIGMCSTIIFGTLLTAKGDLRFLNIVAGVGIVVNAVANLYLIPIYGATGAAIATVTTQSAVSITQFIYSMRILKIEFSLITTGQFILFVSSLTALCYFVRAESALVFISILLAGLISMILFRLIDLKAVSKTLKNKSE